MGGKSAPDSYTFHYAAYLEDAHNALISQGWTQLGIAQAATNPYTGYTVPDADSAFFGVGYVLTDFPSAFDLFGKFMGGLDIEELRSQIRDAYVNDPAIDDAIAAQDTYLEDDINQVSLPKANAGYRDIGAVMSTAFIFNKAFLQAQKQKVISKYSADIKLRMAEISEQGHARHLTWNEAAVKDYMALTSQYLDYKFKQIDKTQDLAARVILWPFQLLDAQKVIIGALNGAAGAGGRTPGLMSSIGQGIGIAGGLLEVGSAMKGLFK